MKDNYFKLERATQVAGLLFVALFGAIVIDSTGALFAKIYNSGPFYSGYQGLGRYILTMFHGGVSFPDPNFSEIPKVEGETFVGVTAHLLVCVFDTFMYFILTFKVLKSTPKIMPALIMMWVFIFMPFFIQMPALGMGWAGDASPLKNIIHWRTFVCHSVFGLGLYLGTILFFKYIHRKNIT
ncbi:DUF2938 family protein [Tenacibaculum sp. SG-28]|uniref:DUF2938 family protein n=1 Tax=Tenacibaculum sp. SG-28 TaxID=754426 RepID=UPI000CF4EC5F|nr:DUF2938 family protein [Tenacibaculum sp. SG-28]PQJ22762.1 hypothetical protein BSU00_00095 [Tenacibaculum sp. SG-28]